MKATRQAQFGYYVAGYEPPSVYEDDCLDIRWSPMLGFRVFDKVDYRLIESFYLSGITDDEAKAIARAYTEDLNDD